MFLMKSLFVLMVHIIIFLFVASKIQGCFFYGKEAHHSNAI